ncbi:hypothetical protein [uncultured Mitsuokella sp.]|uniref:hypothetical protein n=1 Tax=uncultured Mitsuokella sp. TaxID=453120 RepID=UPI0025E5BCE2|nr:hypothetical protein [uncultured Mitsuokella sp.]
MTVIAHGSRAIVFSSTGFSRPIQFVGLSFPIDQFCIGLIIQCLSLTVAIITDGIRLGPDGYIVPAGLIAACSLHILADGQIPVLVIRRRTAVAKVNIG